MLLLANRVVVLFLISRFINAHIEDGNGQSHDNRPTILMTHEPPASNSKPIEHTRLQKLNYLKESVVNKSRDVLHNVANSEAWNKPVAFGRRVRDSKHTKKIGEFLSELNGPNNPRARINPNYRDADGVDHFEK